MERHRDRHTAEPAAGDGRARRTLILTWDDGEKTESEGTAAELLALAEEMWQRRRCIETMELDWCYITKAEIR